MARSGSSYEIVVEAWNGLGTLGCRSRAAGVDGSSISGQRRTTACTGAKRVVADPIDHCTPPSTFPEYQRCSWLARRSADALPTFQSHCPGPPLVKIGLPGNLVHVTPSVDVASPSPPGGEWLEEPV